MDLDYRALGNEGLWCVGRLQTDADRERVVEGLANSGTGESNAKVLESTIKKLKSRWFVIRDAHAMTPFPLLRPGLLYAPRATPAVARQSWEMLNDGIAPLRQSLLSAG